MPKTLPRASCPPSAGSTSSISATSVRIDTGVEQGDEISPFYDPMIAKLIAHAATREEARETLGRRVGRGGDLAGAHQRRLPGRGAGHHADFIAGNVDTGLIAREGEALMPPVPPSDEALADAAAALREWREDFASMPPPGGRAGSDSTASRSRSTSRKAAPSPVEDDRILIAEGGQVWELARWRVDGAAAGGAADGAILAPMPGRIIAVDVVEGQGVAPGQKLVTLEAMKMEHALVAPFAGTVAALSASTGGQVTEGTLLVRIDRSAD